jgi:hypothetical protein
MDHPQRELEGKQPHGDRLGCAVLLAATIGCITMPAGGFLLLAWSALTSLTAVISSAQDGRPVSKLALAGLIMSVPVPLLLWGFVLG